MNFEEWMISEGWDKKLPRDCWQRVVIETAWHAGRRELRQQQQRDTPTETLHRRSRELYEANRGVQALNVSKMPHGWALQETPDGGYELRGPDTKPKKLEDCLRTVVSAIERAGTRTRELMERTCAASPTRWCGTCKQFVAAKEITYQDHHEKCGGYVGNDIPPEN